MIEYYFSPIPGSDRHYKCAKFEGSDQPSNVYFLVIKPVGKTKDKDGSRLPEVHCDCPNRRRGQHINDKHGRMLAKWIIAGKPEGFFDEKGEFHGTGQERIGLATAGSAANEPGADDGESGEPGAELDEDDPEDSAV